MKAAILALTCCVVQPAAAAGRALYGGVLKIATPVRTDVMDPLLSDDPTQATLSMLTARPMCRLGTGNRIIPVFAKEMTYVSPTRLRITLHSDGRAPDAMDVIERWKRLATSPYRGLFAPLKSSGMTLKGLDTVELNLAHPWPDMEATLCHPALSVGVGPYRQTGSGELEANMLFPEGRPFTDSVTIQSPGERGATRLFELGQAHVLLGGESNGATSPTVPLYATYLLFKPDKVGSDFRSVFESSVDRADLARFFVRAPNIPLHTLIPSAQLSSTQTGGRSHAVARPSRDVTLLFDDGSTDQRAVAERIQLKLHDRGYRMVIKGMPRGELRARWTEGDYDMLLHAVLLPPNAAPALAVLLDSAGRKDLLAAELLPLGALADGAARDDRARERAEALRIQLPLIPLYAQGVRVKVAPQVSGLKVDAHGWVVLEELFLTSE